MGKVVANRKWKRSGMRKGWKEKVTFTYKERKKVQGNN